MQDALCIDYLEQTIYPSMPSIQKKCRASCRPEGTAMLSLAMKCVSYPESKRKVEYLFMILGTAIASKVTSLFHLKCLNN